MNLSKADIWNVRRSCPQCDTVRLAIQFATPNEKIRELMGKLNEYVASEPTDFGKKVVMNVEQFTDLETMVLKVIYWHRNNWQVCNSGNYER